MLQQLRAALHPVPKLTSRSAFVAISERSGISLRGVRLAILQARCCRSTMPVVLSTNTTSVLPPVVYNFSNCTVHHVGSSMPNSSSSSDDV